MATTDASSQVKDTGDGFKYNGVASKGRGKLRQKEPSTRADSGAHVQLQRGAPRDDPQALVSELRDSIERKKTELLADGKHGDHIQSCLSSYFSSLRWDHSRKQPSSSRLPTRIYALGIGEISQSRSAQAQVALLLEMADHIARTAEENSKLPSGTSGQGSSSASSQNGKVDSEKSFQPSLRPALMAFDPIFSDIDRAVLTSLGVTPLTREEASAQACYEATFPPSSGGSATTAFQEEYSLMYMPHCPRPLSERYLRAFWSREALLKHRVSFCWNRVGRYAEFLTDEKLNRESPCLYRIIPHLKTHPLPSLSPPYAEALNDLVFEYVRDPDEEIEQTTKAAAASNTRDSNNNNELAESLSRLQLSNPISVGTHASHTLPSTEAQGQIPCADDTSEEAAFTVQVARKKKKRRPQRNGSAREEEKATVRPDIRSEDFWELPPVFESGEGSEEIL